MTYLDAAHAISEKLENKKTAGLPQGKESFYDSTQLSSFIKIADVLEAVNQTYLVLAFYMKTDSKSYNRFFKENSRSQS